MPLRALCLALALCAPASALVVPSGARLPCLGRAHASHRGSLRAPAPTCTTDFEKQEKAAEREETIEYFKTLGTFSFGSLGFFLALTQGAGMEDVLAGNIVLVALCALNDDARKARRGSFLLLLGRRCERQA